MGSAQIKFKECVAELLIRLPQVPVLSNVTGNIMEDPAEIRRLVVEQITQPVRWEDCMRTAKNFGVSEFIECGAGRVLAGLAKKNLPNARVFSADDGEIFAAQPRDGA
jgi:[acyl-carrier-protein] S-malonyltransferase